MSLRASAAGSNAAGIFAPFALDDSVKLIGVEAGGRGTDWANMRLR